MAVLTEFIYFFFNLAVFSRTTHTWAELHNMGVSHKIICVMRKRNDSFQMPYGHIKNILPHVAFTFYSKNTSILM